MGPARASPSAARAGVHLLCWCAFDGPCDVVMHGQALLCALPNVHHMGRRCSVHCPMSTTWAGAALCIAQCPMSNVQCPPHRSTAARTLESTAAALSPQRRPPASSSSMNTTQGATLRASANSSLMRAAPLPTNISTNSLALTDRKGTRASPATARARSVLPAGEGRAPCIRHHVSGIRHQASGIWHQAPAAVPGLPRFHRRRGCQHATQLCSSPV
jgi:hypothetical protein